ncbi:MAG TPA: hypothetical protein VFB51_14910 [Solirubrobacterales bacterium]|nr:hypothetical protein [Solirubrobacterales bacterium]
MKVTAERGGGIAGPRYHERIGPIETEFARNGAAIVALLKSVGFFELPERYPQKHRISDALWGTLEVEDGARTHKVAYQTGSEIPGELSEILKLLSEEFRWDDVARAPA